MNDNEISNLLIYYAGFSDYNVFVIESLKDLIKKKVK